MSARTFTTDAEFSIEQSSPEIAAFLLRLTMGVFFVAHAGLKVFVYTPAGTAGFFESLGVPGVLAYAVIAGEFVGGAALILGVWTRYASLALVPILLGAIVTVHGANGFFFTNQGGGWEYPAFWAMALIIQALLGDGAYSVSVRPRR